MKIRSLVLHGHCFVYVKPGRSHLSDVFLKWCCEFTCSSPWCYLFFENIQTVDLLPEIQDRINLAFYSEGICRQQLFIQKVSSPSLAAESKESQEKFSRSSGMPVINMVSYPTSVPFLNKNPQPWKKLNRDDRISWAEECSAELLQRSKSRSCSSKLVFDGIVKTECSDPWFERVQDILHIPRSAFESESNRYELPTAACLIAGPPGCGKSFLMENQVLPFLRKHKYPCAMVDCSTEKFFLMASSEVLDNLYETMCDDEESSFLFVLDEAHFLGPLQTEEVGRWFLKHRGKCSLILIANACYDYHEEMLQECHRLECLSSSKNPVRTIFCSLSESHINQVYEAYRHEDPSVADSERRLLHLLASISSYLIDDSAFSLRTLGPVVQECLRSHKQQDVKPSLVRKVMERQPFLGLYFVSEFVSQILAIFHSQSSSDEEDLSESAASDHRVHHSVLNPESPVAILVTVAYAASKGAENNCQLRSFKHFSKGLSSLPPPLRLLLWATQILNICRDAYWTDPLFDSLHLILELDAVASCGFIVTSLSGRWAH